MDSIVLLPSARGLLSRGLLFKNMLVAYTALQAICLIVQRLASAVTELDSLANPNSRGDVAHWAAQREHLQVDQTLPVSHQSPLPSTSRVLPLPTRMLCGSTFRMCRRLWHSSARCLTGRLPRSIPTRPT